MKSSHKKLISLAILLAFLVPLGMAVAKVHRQIRQDALNRALIAAVKKKDTTNVIALLSEGADANSIDLQPDTRPIWRRLWDCIRGRPFSNASVSVGHEHFALLLVYYGDTPANNARLVKALLDAGARVNVADEIGLTPLMSVVSTRNQDIVGLFLQHGAQVNAQSKDASTALLYAANAGEVPSVQLLLHNGALVNLKNNDGESPLQGPASAGDITIVRMLLESGADPNARTNDGSTPLSGAAQFNNVDCVKLLLANGAQVNTKDKYGKTPLMLAAEYYNKQIVQMLKKAGAKE